MKILHLMLSNFYIEKYNYQENILPKLNLLDGHETKIIASTESFIDNIKIGYLEPSAYINDNGIEVVRVPYSQLLMPFALKRKIRKYPGIYQMIESFGPDIILFHGIQALELLTVARYKKHHPHVRFYVDSHSDRNNSAQTFVSKTLLHRLFYRILIALSIKYIDKIFYISTETKDFLIENYKLSDEIMEFYPLGGNILDEPERLQKRSLKRTELGLKEEDILFLHSGKMDQGKRTGEILRAFSRVSDDRFRLVLIGSAIKSVESEIIEYAARDPRITYLGWKAPDELLDYLCASDMYVQPGGQSVTMQNALCVFTPIMLFPHKSHIPYMQNNGYYVETADDIYDCMMRIADNPALLKPMRENSEKVARNLLDYRKLAARLYQ